MKYDTPFRDMPLDGEVSFDLWTGMTAEEQHVTSDATFDALDALTKRWFSTPGALCCRLNTMSQELWVYLRSPDEDDHSAEFKLPFAEIVLSAAHTSLKHTGTPPSAVSAMLRDLADQIDREV